ncbi:Hypothetical predicted protein [Olea europaea subsp. europaea]|uniref:Uncharacterized protein n=1 Tax=Olea europaea subsp. europaea TaxID=158383 RepID=A0A8S0UKL9_OLEEU|nr:Hypothetical predicted protein [Olea europaea subsp. europaea]
MSDAKMKNEKDVSYTIHEFLIVMQIWAYEAMPELDERFGEQVGERSPRFLCRTSTKQPHCMCTPHCVPRRSSVICHTSPFWCHFPDCPMEFFDDLASTVVGPQFHEAAPASGGHEGSAEGDEHDDESGVGAEDDETSANDDRQTQEGNGDDRSKANDSGDSGRDASSETVLGTHGGPTVTRDDVEGMLYDQRILFKMRLQTVKLEIMQHMTEEFAKLRDFISTLVPPFGGTFTSTVAPVMNEPNIWNDPHESMSLYYCNFQLHHVYRAV